MDRHFPVSASRPLAAAPLVTPLLLALLGLATGCDDGDDPDVPTGFGAPCGDGVTCPAGLSCVEDAQFPGGYCTSICADGSCPGEGVCVDSIAPPLCLAPCADASECRDGYQCFREACRPRCTGDAGCGPGATCRPDGICEAAACVSPADCGPGQTCRASQCVASAGDAGVQRPHGSPCAVDAECEGGVCLPEPLGGVCSLPCAEADDCFEFDVAAGCSSVPTDTDGDGAPDAAPTICVLSPPGAEGLGRLCAGDDACTARLCQQGQCTEVCDDDGDCLPGQRCTSLPRAGAGGATYLGCGYGPSTPLETVDLGEVDVRAGFGETFQIATPPDAVSLTLDVRDLSGAPPLELAFTQVLDPRGTSLFDIDTIAMLRDTPVRWLPSDTSESITMLVPNTTPDRVTFVPGVHTFTVGPFARSAGDTATARLRVLAHVKRSSSGPPTAGVLDLNVYLVGVDGVDAASAPGNDRLRAGLARVGDILGQQGITIGAVRYADVNDAGLRVIDSTEGSDSELSRLFRSGSLGGRALDVYLVRSIGSGSEGFRSLGVAGGIPGPVELPGSRHDGVVVSWSGSRNSRILGTVLAHEIGHYLGLFHVTERLRPCEPGESPFMVACAPFGGGDTLADTALGDEDNLMHWSIVDSGRNTALSPGQGFVLRASALVAR